MEDLGHGRVRRYAAALASTLLPGLGQLLYGRRRLAAAFLVPTIACAAAVVGIVVATDRVALAARLVDPGVLGALLVVQLAILAWRFLAVGSSLLVAQPPRYGARDVLPLVLLGVIVALPQAYVFTVTEAAREAAVEVFGAADAGPVWRPSAAPSPGTGSFAPAGSAAPSAQASPAPTAAASRLTVLLIGEDSGVGRRTALTDTMIVASLDPAGRTVSMLSIPRDLVDAPIPGGGVWHPKINSLAAWVRFHPDQFPGSNGVGQAVLAGVISELIGVPIGYWAQVNLSGLIRIVDTVGGVDVTVTHGFCDPGYDEYGQQGFGIPAGRWHVDGSQALAYARVRKAAGESDFTRAARQQEVLAGLRDAVVRGGFLGDPIGFLQAIGQAVRTNVPPAMVPEIAGYAAEVGRERLFRDVVTYPLVRSGMDVRGSILIPDIAGIRALAAGMFPDPGITPVVGGTAANGQGGTGSPAPASPGPTTAPATLVPAPPAGRAPNAPRLVCHAPTPTPTPRPIATPTPAPSGSAAASGSPGASASPVPTATPTAAATP